LRALRGKYESMKTSRMNLIFVSSTCAKMDFVAWVVMARCACTGILPLPWHDEEGRRLRRQGEEEEGAEFFNHCERAHCSDSGAGEE